MTLHELGIKHGTDKAYAHGYCDFYESILPKPDEFVGKKLLEIGIKDGASLKMWRDYYPGAFIRGIDINEIKVPGCITFKMDQKDQNALAFLGGFDIIIDDGSHFTLDQQLSFNQLYYKQLNKGGFYIMEDCHTSFYPSYKNSSESTYSWLKMRFDIIEWCRVEDKSDSLTVIIKK